MLALKDYFVTSLRTVRSIFVKAHVVIPVVMKIRGSRRLVRSYLLGDFQPLLGSLALS